MVLERFDEHLPHFQFKSDFLLYCNSLCPEFENVYTLVTRNKTSKHPKGESASCQTCQDNINLTEILNEDEKRNDSLESTGNCSEPGTQANDHQDINTAFYKGLRLEGTFVSKTFVNMSRRNLSSPEISLLSKGLKFVSSANKIDQAKLKRERESWKNMEGSYALCGTFVMMSELLQLRNLDLNLLLIQGIKTLSLKCILVAWRRDYWT